MYFKPLTGLRFIAALMVFITHLAPRTYGPFINNLLDELQVGVPIFFVLSGFLIAYRYYSEDEMLKGGAFNYFINRFTRIIPLYLIITVANSIWYNLDSKLTILNLTLLHGFFSVYAFSPLPHTWSLTVECTFYTLVPLIFLLIRKKIGIIPQALIFLSIGGLLTLVFNVVLKLELWGNIKYMLVLTFFGRCFEFLIGIKLALFIKKKNILTINPSHFMYGSIVIFILIMIFLSLMGGLNTNTGIFLHNIMLPISIAFILFGLIVSKTFVSDMLASPLFQLLGNSSYAFFLIHYGFWQRFMIKYMFIDFILELLATVLLSILLYKLFEEPLIKYAKNKIEIKNRIRV